MRCNLEMKEAVEQWVFLFEREKLRSQRRKRERTASGLRSNWITVSHVQRRREKTDVLMVTEMRWNKRRQPEQGRKDEMQIQSKTEQVRSPDPIDTRWNLGK
ncbi:hypothetical protein AV530_004678 [Patagioenas fasciata monilis]|uniref:Uncharacterized protein n=1 Tax=Patagioenas fasciata monilis TaxID=372326 RepID=A0A1V4KHU9_PATFA|nr:hypothetical protein AV530_004678 [Patagioenas fasciata monilis]